MKADDKCCHCFRDFADHNYVPDSINKWACPVPQYDTHYGYACSDNFMPDPEYGEDSPIGVSVIEYESFFELLEEEP